ncbi:MAG: hypothetical protein FJY85_11990 [Deltaproteobacteria bacterium]|nr:hypothetical protein [Chloroflexota bacterium]MBM3300664.1 hypothetical protein [Deltaproteobacteria bacterium]
MRKVSDLTTEELELLIEQKVEQIVGDPDSGLQLKEEFKAELKKRLRQTSGKTSQEEMLKRFG